MSEPMAQMPVTIEAASTPVNFQNTPLPSGKPRKFERLAWWLDSSVRVPGTSYRVGIDGFLGLLPGVGDFTGLVISSSIMLYAVKMDVPFFVVLRMALNIILEMIVGVVPVLGDIFDFVFKSNLRNVNLLREFVDQPSEVNRRSMMTVLGIAAVASVFFLGIGWGVWRLIMMVIKAAGSLW